jgi:hypothetical protein
MQSVVALVVHGVKGGDMLSRLTIGAQNVLPDYDI